MVIHDFTGAPAGIATEEGFWADALELQTALVNCKMRAFKSGEVVINQGTVVADLEAAECDYQGYAEKTIAAVGAPIRDSDGSVVLNVPSQQFDFVTGAGEAENLVGGVWIEDASGDVRRVFEFEEPTTVNSDESGFIVHAIFRVPDESLVE